jgi:spermidine synthase
VEVPLPKRATVTALFLLSGGTGLVYEIVWIRLFSISFGNTAQALSTVLSVFLGGLALGAFWAGKVSTKYSQKRPLQAYGWIEIATGVYALAIPWLIESTQPVLRALYGSGQGSAWVTVAARALLCSAVLVPATVLMGATLPLLARWVSATATGESGRRVGVLYTVNLAGASGGALLSGFALLPALGFSRTLQLTCAVNVAIGLVALALSREVESPKAVTNQRSDRTVAPVLATRIWVTVSFVSGAICMLYEVAWSRTFGLLFGPTASTVTLVLATFLAGLTLGGIAAGRLRNHLIAWLCCAQFACAGLLLWTFLGAGAAPHQVAEWVRAHSAEPAQIELMKIMLLATTLLPLTIAIGLIFPLILRFKPAHELEIAKRIGGMYGVNTAGCICGSLLTGWMLIPLIGTERTLFLGGLLNVGLGLLMFFCIKPGKIKLALVACAAAVVLAMFLVPRWNMAALTAGAYKYAPYYSPAGEPFNTEEVVFLKEGKSGTVAVRKSSGSMLLSIDGKVDASDAGGDLLTEKLLAHLPLIVSGAARNVCLIGLASGVTAGAALTHPIQTLDVVEISSDVVEASQFFHNVNHDPLADPRAKLILNDGRNHLALTHSQYDVIISEPSNPWIAGMNSLFTRDFFRIARSRLNQAGVFAQWFHIYNLPQDDLQSLFRAFTEVFPSAILWQLNDGDVLLTGFADDTLPRVLSDSGGLQLSRAASVDLSSVGVTDPKLLLKMYVMRDQDLRRFAAEARPNTDDDPRLEFHGQRDLHAQTDVSNADGLAAFVREVSPPATVQAVREQLGAAQYIASAAMFEHAESYRSAFSDYQMAFRSDAQSREALAGMDRCARLPQERSAVAVALSLPEGSEDTLEKRTELALAKAERGDVTGAEFLLEENAQAHPLDSAARFNYGLFCLERKDYRRAIDQFEKSIDLNPKYLPAYEAMAESYLQLHDERNAVEWSRRILQIDPNHAVARQTLARLEGR